MASGQEKDDAGKEEISLVRKFQSEKNIPKDTVEGPASTEFVDPEDELLGPIDPSKLSRFTKEGAEKPKESTEKGSGGGEAHKGGQNA